MKGNKLFYPIFVRTLAVFLAFWLLMTGVLTYLNQDRLRETLDQNTMAEIRDDVARNVRTTLDGTAAPEDQPAIFTRWLGSGSYDGRGALFLSRVYDEDGTELARGQLTSGSFSLPGTGVYNYYIHFDPVLTDAEQLELGRRLQAEPTLSSFYGTDGGLYEDYAPDGGLYGEVTGILDGAVVYPQKLVFHYTDRSVTILDSDSSLFQDAGLTTLRFDAARITSPFLWRDLSPDKILKLYRQAEATLDRLLEENPPPSHQWAGSLFQGHSKARCGVVSPYDVTVGSAYAYDPWILSTSGLIPTYVLTLLAALVMAIFISRVQANSLRKERDLTRAVAHELRTPLALLRSYAEGLQEDIAPANRGEYLQVIMDETDRMDGLVGSLLDLSRLEAGAAGVKREPVDLSELVRAAFLPLEKPLAERGSTLSLDLSPCVLSSDPGRLSLVVSNLASNALRHCAPGGSVRVGVSHVRGKVCLSVENDGFPIPPEALPRLWEPFYRGDDARSRDAGGAGLGLALVRSSVALLGGTCGAENSTGGVRFWCMLPFTKVSQP